MKEWEDRLYSTTELAKRCGYTHAGQIPDPARNVGAKAIYQQIGRNSTFYSREDAMRIVAYSHAFDKSCPPESIVLDGQGFLICRRCKTPVPALEIAGPHKNLCSECWQFSVEILGKEFAARRTGKIETKNVNTLPAILRACQQGHAQWPGSFLIAVMSIGNQSYFRAFSLSGTPPAPPWIRLVSMQKHSANERYVAKRFPSCPKMYAYVEESLNTAKAVEELL